MAMGSAASAGRAKDWSRRASGEIFSSVGFLFAGIGASAPFIAGQPVDLCRYFYFGMGRFWTSKAYHSVLLLFSH
jgi:hypothetical protein